MSSSHSRRRVLTGSLGLGLGGLLASCGRSAHDGGGGGSTSPSPTPTPRAPKPQKIAYGEADQQYGELTVPAGRSRGTVVVIHGGFWMIPYGTDLGQPLAADLVARGWTTWNIAYRRVGDQQGGWPGTFADVAAAIDHLADLDLSPGSRDAVLALGHSAGGHLATWAATRDASTPGGAPRVELTGVVSQAGLVELTSAAQQRVGGSATDSLMGGSPAQHPDRYALGDPAKRLDRLRAPVRCTHGRDDRVVPQSQSRTFTEAAAAAGRDAELVLCPGGHFEQIDPASDAWPLIRSTLEALG